MSRLNIALLSILFFAECFVCQRFIWVDSTNRDCCGSKVFRLNIDLGINQLTSREFSQDLGMRGYTAAVFRPEDGLFYAVMDMRRSYQLLPTKSSFLLRGALEIERLVGEPFSNNVSVVENNIAVRTKNNEVEIIIADSDGLRAFNAVTNATRLISSYENFTRVAVTSTDLYASDGSNFYRVYENDGTMELLTNQSIKFMIPHPNQTIFYCSVKNGEYHQIYTFEPVTKKFDLLVDAKLLERFAIAPDGFIYAVLPDVTTNKLFYFHRFSTVTGKSGGLAVTVASEGIWNGLPIVIPYFNVIWEKPILQSQLIVKGEFAVFNMTYKRYYWTSKAEFQRATTFHFVPNPMEEFVTFGEASFTDRIDEQIFVSSIDVPVPQDPSYSGISVRFRVKYTGEEGWVGYSDEYITQTITRETERPAALSEPTNQPTEESVSGASRLEALLFVMLFVGTLLL